MDGRRTAVRRPTVRRPSGRLGQSLLVNTFYFTSRPPAGGRNRNWGCRFPKGDSGIQNAECACRRTVVRTAVGQSSDGCRTAVGWPSDGRRTTVGRPSDARMTVVGRFTVLSRNPIFDALAHSSRAALISPYRREVSFSIRFFLIVVRIRD